jgi:hypothetical protein
MEDTNYKTLLGILIKSMMTDYEGNKAVNHEARLVVGTTPQILVDLGFPQLPLVIDGSVIDKAFFDHGIPKSKLERIYNLIAAPKAVYAAHQKNPGSVVVTYEIKDAKPVIIPIHPNRPKARNEFFNVIASMYPKASSDGGSIEARWKKEGLLLWEAPLEKAS